MLRICEKTGRPARGQMSKAPSGEFSKLAVMTIGLNANYFHSTSSARASWSAAKEYVFPTDSGAIV